MNRVIPALGAVAIFSMLPVFLGDGFFVFFLTSFFIFAMLATGLQFLIGCAGILSLGHASFFGIGAYCSGILTGRYDVPFLLALPVSGLLAGLGGLLMAPIIRLREVYFAMASFAFGIVVNEVFTHWKSMTGGHDGFPSVPFASLGGYALDTPAKLYYFALALLSLQCVLFSYLRQSSFGRSLNVMRQNEAGAKSIGLNLVALKVWVIVITSVSAGIAGSLFAHLNGSVSPQMFHWSQSINVLTMVVVGGVANIAGLFSATFVLMYLTQYLRWLSEYTSLVNGIVLTLFVVFLPAGIGSLFVTLRKRWKSASKFEEVRR
jgi:branched-chain amino acid transport system permease protein